MARFLYLPTLIIIPVYQGFTQVLLEIIITEQTFSGIISSNKRCFIDPVSNSLVLDIRRKSRVFSHSLLSGVQVRVDRSHFVLEKAENCVNLALVLAVEDRESEEKQPEPDQQSLTVHQAAWGESEISIFIETWKFF